jgi:hypothetical protein
MKNISKSATESLTQPTQVSVKNKARLSEMMAFSFSKHLAIHQSNTFKKATIVAFSLRFTCRNETSSNSMTQVKIISVIIPQWQTSPEGGIVLLRLLVAV